MSEDKGDALKTGVGEGLRFNQGKTRYDLVNPYAERDMADVLTYGAEKYTDRNWENGLTWTSVIASAKRHLAAIEMGEDFDDGIGGSGKLHVANLACNIHFLNSFYYIFPQGDNRIKLWQKVPKIGLDIDEVLVNFVDGWANLYGEEFRKPLSWYFDYDMMDRFTAMKEDKTLNDFYLNLKPLFDPLTIPFEPHCYITSRPVDTSVTQKWIAANNFPQVKVYTVPVHESKLEVAKAAGIEVFVDDKFETFKEFNNNGITCYLYDQPHNRRYNVGHLRIKTLNELPWFKK